MLNCFSGDLTEKTALREQTRSSDFLRKSPKQKARHCRASYLVNLDVPNWNQLKRELIDWNMVLSSPSVAEVRELVLS